MIWRCVKGTDQLWIWSVHHSSWTTLEKDPLDIQFKDINTTAYCLLCYIGFVQFISLFIPPVSSGIVYQISHFYYFLSNFYSVSWIVYLYIQYMYIFYPDEINDVPISTIRFRSFLCKCFLTVISVLLSIFMPFESQPIVFNFLAKEKQYER